MSYKLITFDFTGTLMRFRMPPAIQYQKIASLYGIEIENNHQAFHSHFKTAFKQVNKEHPNFGATTNLHWTQWWLQVVKGSFTKAGVLDSPSLEAAAWHLIRLYSTTKGWEIIPGAERVLQLLRQKGQRIGVISNFDPRLYNILQEAGLTHYFEFVLPSYDAKCFKPQKDIFEFALAKCSKEPTKPIECCHIGDTFHEDYQGAIQAGWNAILVNHQSNNHQDPIKGCKNLKELEAHLLV